MDDVLFIVGVGIFILICLLAYLLSPEDFMRGWHEAEEDLPPPWVTDDD